MKKLAMSFVLCCLCVTSSEGIVINEIMYHPTGDNEADLEWLELYNDDVVPLDVGGWSFSKGISYQFSENIVLAGKSYVVVCANKIALMGIYPITKDKLYGPFEGRLDSGGEQIALVDKLGAVMAHVHYRDRDPWPAGADGTGFSLALINPDLPMDESESWAVSAKPLGSPGQPNGFEEETTITDTPLVQVGELWKYFKGTEPPSADPLGWTEPDFDDSTEKWLSGPTGIGYGDGDDATEVTDMQNAYRSVFCRKKFEVTNVSSIDSVVFKIAYDDGFIAFLNGPEQEIGRKNMGNTGDVFTYNMEATTSVGDLPESAEFNVPKSYLREGTNVLAVQIHNYGIGSSDLSMIPSLSSRKVKTSGGVTPMPVVINEFLANSSGETFVELFNNSNADMDIGLTYLSDDPLNLMKYQIPAGTVIKAWKPASFSETAMGFPLPQGDAAIYLTTPDAARIIDAQAYATERLDMSRGRYPDGEGRWYTMHTPTPGEPNEISVNTSIVINELMFHPYENDDTLEYIELYNRGTEAVDMSGWSFDEGVDFVFPIETTLDAGDYLVVAKNQETIAQKYAVSNVIGNFGGNLENEGEKVELVDAIGNVVDEVRYSGGGRWPIWAAGWGSSLELIDPRQDNSSPSAWAASDERSRAVWTRIEYSGQFSGGESEFHFFLMHRGECLIDDISMKRGGQEYIPNGSFESGTSGWKIEGNHIQSSIYTQEARSGARCLKIVATGRGDTGANRIECDTTTALSSGQTYTISFWVKWQRGVDLIYTRTHSQGAPRASRIPMPSPRGTPGKPNTVYLSNLGPVIWDVTQKPIVPKSADSVRITAKISDSDGVTSVTLYYRGDNDANYNSVQMFDDGSHNDRRAGDGLYAGEIPPRGSIDLMRFYIVPQDALSATQRFPAMDGRFCLYQIENTPPSTKLPIYRILLSREADQQMRSQVRLSNELADCTFVLNNTQIYYNCGVRTRGSGWTRGTHPSNQYRIEFNADQPLRGVQEEMNLDWDNADGTKQHDWTVHHLLRKLGGVPTSYHKYVHVRFNANFTALSVEVQKVDGAYARHYWPDDAQGNLFEVDDRFEWTDSWNHGNWDAYMRWLGADKEKYRWNFELRTNEKEDDYSGLLDFISFMDPARTNNTTFDDQALGVLDVSEWLKVLCVRFLVDDWDTYGYNRGKNAYFYKPLHRGDGTPQDPPRDGKWALIPWDSDLTFNNASAPIVSGQFTDIQRMINRPQFQRLYYGYYLWLIDGPFSRAQIDPVLDRTYQAVASEPGAPSGPDGMKSFITNRISAIRSMIQSDAKFAITTNSGMDFEVQVPQVTLEGVAPFIATTMNVKVNDGPDEPLKATWLDSKRWRATFSLGPSINRFVVTGLAVDNKVVGTASITVTWGLSPTTDTDNDGLFDREEGEVYHTDYMNPDTDGDGLTDGNEVHVYFSDPTKKDTDGDGLTDPEEVITYLTDPRKADTDDDSLPDKWEIENQLNPKVADGDDGANGDPDADGLTNLAEYQSGTNPRNADTDGDAMSDPWEIQWGFNPNVGTGPDGPDGDRDGDGLTNLGEYRNGTNPSKADSDDDGLNDLWEVQNNLDPNSGQGNDGPDGDPDGDGLTNQEEFAYGTKPKSNDSDSDQMDDRWEIQNNLDPTSSEGDNGSAGDLDGDGLTNLREYQSMTKPNNRDTDDDGMDDFWEVENGLDPTQPTGDNGPDGDPDGDQIQNLKEYQYGLDPWTPNTDTDQDGLSDLWEITYGLSPTSPDGNDGAGGDPDGDGLSNADELQKGTSPVNPDSDSDGMNDGWEVQNGLDPASNVGDDGATGDPDADTLLNKEEYDHNANPRDPDTDDDGMGDAWEVRNGLDPASAEGENGPDGDPDDDGSSNMEEMIAGTLPLSAESVFAVVSIGNNGSSITITWSTVEGKRYRILAADTIDGTWTPIAADIVGTGQPALFEDGAGVSQGKAFYKVEVYY